MVASSLAQSRAHQVELSVPASTEYTQIVRLVLSGIGNAMGLNLEEIEDLKLAVAEACYNVFSPDPLMTDQITIRVSTDSEKLVVDVFQTSERPSLPRLFAAGNNTEKGIGVVLMKHLVDKVEYKTSSSGVEIRLVKFHAGVSEKTA